jgi:hypothetical protein
VLPCDTEAVGRVALACFRVACGRRAVEEIDVMCTMFDAVAQHVDCASPRDLALQPSQELATRGAIAGEVEGICRFRLRFVQEGRELQEVHAVLAVVYLGGTADPAGTVDPRAPPHRGLLRVG